MKIRFKECTSAVPFSRPGMVREINDVLARKLIDLGHAEEVREEPETATHAAPETAAERPRRRRGMKDLINPLLRIE
ncbi:MAG: hypothetical protein FJ143_16220 [Deltaproteobacteria bacterium]|nr:hypothetical protein [Deltaproteobacteria bacterium]